MSKATMDLRGGETLVIKGVSHEIAKVTGKPIVRLISTASVDSDGDIIHQGPNDKGRGWLLDAYNANPKIFFGHQTWNMPLGGGRAYLDKHPTFGMSLFHEDDFDMEDAAAAALEGKVRRGYISDSSVGFIGVLSSPREDAPYGRDFFEQRLLEATYCNWGANPDTEVMAKDFFGRNPGLALRVETGDSVASLQQQKDVADALADLGARLRTVEKLLGEREVVPVLDSLVEKMKADGLIQ